MSDKHWTAGSVADFRYSVIADYLDQVCEHIDGVGISQRELAGRLGVSESFVSQVVNGIPNMTVGTMVEWARVLGLKLSVVLYDDGDTGNASGPILSDVFRECWVKCGKPRGHLSAEGTGE